MSIIQLTKHKVIGIDIDKTLIQGPKSLLLQRFILANLDKKQFHLITFRTGKLASEIPQDIKTFSSNRLSQNDFKSLHAIPFDLYFGYMFHKILNPATNKIEDIHTRLQRISKQFKIPTLDIISLIDDALEWKGKTCYEIGCTAIVDDKYDEVKPGADAYGVQYFNAYSL